jgi:hypothetical protein
VTRLLCSYSKHSSLPCPCPSCHRLHACSEIQHILQWLHATCLAACLDARPIFLDLELRSKLVGRAECTASKGAEHSTAVLVLHKSLFEQPLQPPCSLASKHFNLYCTYSDYLRRWCLLADPNIVFEDLRTYTCCTSDVANKTSTRVGFVLEPNAGRGTVGILWQCLATIFLCIYTCLRLNVPPRPLSRARAMLRYFMWIIIGIIVPELMYMKALGELIYAKILYKYLVLHNLGSLSIKQAHFLPWGCLRIEHKGQLLKSHRLLGWLYNVFADEDSEKSRRFLEFLLQQVPSDAIIYDRSKADAIAKVLSCLQALWVATQAIARYSNIWIYLCWRL